ncbi:MAG: type III-A CRISPR-associated protein Csm2 [Leptolyngbyaceae cyanobacterium bins.59]|nr:type III-A CRISPR-associated protein Csm2 [Leptolyngbyaceae cyanobacterium bins.59]
MTANSPNRPSPRVNTPVQNQESRSRQSPQQEQSSEITEKLVSKIRGFTGGLKSYSIRELVQDAEAFGPYLKQRRLETNQIRKFLDAINRIKADLTEGTEFSKIETDVVLLKPKLAYAAARQAPAKPLSDVMAAAIDQVHSREDFDRLVQLIESIIAYHKAEGGK